MTETSSYAEVRELVVAHERISFSWSRDRVLADVGAGPVGMVTSYATGDGGAAPMEVNMVKGKGKQKGQNAKGKGKGKPVFPKGKSKGKGSDKGKGKNNNGKGYGDNTKGSSKGGYANKLDSNTCAYCGHWAKDCHKKKADMQVRQVEEGDPKDTAHTSGTASSSAQAVRAVLIFEPPMDFPYVKDLTALTALKLRQPFQVVHGLFGLQCLCSLCQYDMTCTDHDQFWTLCPDLKTCCCVNDSSMQSAQHVRVVIARMSTFSCTTRIATLQFGNVAFKEKFIVADVTTPLIALGHIIRSGWSLVQTDSGPCLVKGENSIDGLYKNNSLCARGCITMVSEVSPQDALPAIRAVQLGIVIRTLAAGWNRLSPHMFAIKTTLPKFVDTTPAPSDELMWLRTTLVCREGGNWEVQEFCEAIEELPAGIDKEIQ